MKKYLSTIFLALLTGFFLCSFFLHEYDDYKGIKVSSSGESLYFVQYGVYSSIESMEKNTISLENYIYNKEDNLYYVYISITKSEEVLKKIQNYYKEQGINTISKEFVINNKNFINKVNEYDKLIKESDDSTYISSIINQTLISYEEDYNGKN